MSCLCHHSRLLDRALHRPLAEQAAATRAVRSRIRLADPRVLRLVTPRPPHALRRLRPPPIKPTHKPQPHPCRLCAAARQVSSLCPAALHRPHVRPRLHVWTLAALGRREERRRPLLMPPLIARTRRMVPHLLNAHPLLLPLHE